MFSSPQSRKIALCHSADGTVFGLLKRTGSTSTENSYLVTVNTATAEITNIGETDARYDGLVFIPAN